MLAERCEGTHLSGPNDLAFRKDGTLYLSDTNGGVRGAGHDPKEELPATGVYMLKNGTLADPDPNGLAFSPDEEYINLTAATRVLLRHEDASGRHHQEGRRVVL